MDKEEFKEMGLTLLAFASSYVLKKIMEESYERVYKEEPPNAVTDKDIKWGHVIGWTIASGLVATATKVLVKRYGAQKLEVDND